MAKVNSKTKVSIIILTINSLEMVKKELIDISKLIITDLDVTCVVVDNGSVDGTEKELKNHKIEGMDFKYIQTESNLGFAGGNNVGIKYVLDNGADYILLLNNDVILPSNILINLIKFMNATHEAGIVSPKIYFAKNHEFHKGRYTESEKGKVIWYAGGIIDRNNVYTAHRGVDEVDHGQYDKIQDTDVANGAAVIIRREVFKEIGLLDA